MRSILLATTSELKLEVVRKLFPSENFNITTINCDDCGLPPQPFNSSEKCAKVRLDYVKRKTYPQDFDYVIAIENGIDRFINNSHCEYVDICHVLIEFKGLLVHSTGNTDFDIPREKIRELYRKQPHDIPELNIKGYSCTIGDIYHESDPNIDPKNWVVSVYNKDRRVQIEDSLESAFEKAHNEHNRASNIISKYKHYNDYPKQGVIFQDFFSVIREKEDIQQLFSLLRQNYKYNSIDYIVGPESRGFFGFGLSCFGNYGFIPLRKKGKLPGEIRSVTYDTEYSTDTLEISADIPPNSNVVVFDDLIATGGSLRAACDLLESLECNIIDCVVLREVQSLRSIAKLKVNRPYTVLLQD